MKWKYVGFAVKKHEKRTEKMKIMQRVMQREDIQVKKEENDVKLIIAMGRKRYKDLVINIDYDADNECFKIYSDNDHDDEYDDDDDDD